MMAIQSAIINSKLVCVLLLSLAMLGCGDTSEPIGAVHGTVSFQGQPVTKGMVQFSNAEKGVYISAPIKDDGTYRVETDKGVGIPLGKYAIAIVPPVPVVITGQPIPPPEEHEEIPQRYRDPKTSELQAEVTSKGIEYKIDMKP